MNLVFCVDGSCLGLNLLQILVVSYVELSQKIICTVPPILDSAKSNKIHVKRDRKSSLNARVPLDK